MATVLWAAQLERTLTQQETDMILQLLPAERKERILRLRAEEKKQEILCAYLLLHTALYQEFRWEKIPEVALTEQGKPYFPEYPNVHFNISHTGGAVLVGISDQPLGVDIEKVRPVSLRTMRRLADGGTEETFFRSWVRREARVKCSGAGIGTMMRAETPLQHGEHYYEVDTFPGYVAGVASGSEETPEKVRKYLLDELL